MIAKVLIMSLTFIFLFTMWGIAMGFSWANLPYLFGFSFVGLFAMVAALSHSGHEKDRIDSK